jgi:hypothetical protein
MRKEIHQKFHRIIDPVRPHQRIDADEQKKQRHQQNQHIFNPYQNLHEGAPVLERF